MDIWFIPFCIALGGFFTMGTVALYITYMIERPQGWNFGRYHYRRDLK